MLDCADNTFVSVAFGRGQITLSELLGGVMTPWPPPKIRHCTLVTCPRAAATKFLVLELIVLSLCTDIN